MRQVFGGLLAAGALALAPPPAHAGELALRDVVELHRTGLGDDLLIAVIEADGGVFRLDFADIQNLRSDGLSERVVAALVRTGARAHADGASAVPVVRVSQEVVTYAPTVVVLGAPAPAERHRPADRPKHRPEPTARAAAAWVTRQGDGKNVPTAGAPRSTLPPATWVTPRDRGLPAQPEPVKP